MKALTLLRKSCTIAMLILLLFFLYGCKRVDAVINNTDPVAETVEFNVDGQFRLYRTTAEGHHYMINSCGGITHSEACTNIVHQPGIVFLNN